MNYCRIFTEIAEALLHRMLESTKNNNGIRYSLNVFSLLDLVLTCVGHHDYEVFPDLFISFNFFFYFGILNLKGGRSDVWILVQAL